MRLLLKEDVENVGAVGDEVVVKDGYGRNYLIPKGKAIIATPKNLKAFKHQKAVVQRKLKKVIGVAEELAAKIAKTPCTVTKKVGEQGKLFGSVTLQEIADLLKAQGIEVDRRKFQLKEPIKTIGEHKVPLKLNAGVVAEVQVNVIKEETEETEDKPEKTETAAEEVVEESAEKKAAGDETTEEPTP